MTSLDFQDVTRFDTDVLVSPVQFQTSVLLEIAEKWLDKQDDLWPDTITADILTQHLKLVYVAHWLVSGEGSATWSATVGKEYTRLVICKTCGGGGKIKYGSKVVTCTTCNGSCHVEEKYVDWTHKSGVVNHRFDKHPVMNISRIYRPISKLKGKLQNTIFLNRKNAEDYKLLPPESTMTEVGRRTFDTVMRDTIKNEARQQAHRLGQVKHLQVAYVTTNFHDIATWLYPIYTGTYVYEGELLQVMVDGLTGKLHVQSPASVRQARTTRRTQFIALVVFIIGLIILLWMIYHWL